MLHIIFIFLQNFKIIHIQVLGGQMIVQMFLTFTYYDELGQLIAVIHWQNTLYETDIQTYLTCASTSVNVKITMVYYIMKTVVMKEARNYMYYNILM